MAEDKKKISARWFPRPPQDPQKKRIFLYDFEISTRIDSKKRENNARSVEFEYEVKIFYFDKKFAGSNEQRTLARKQRVEQIQFARKNATFTHVLKSNERSSLFVEVTKKLKDRFKNEKFIREWDNVINSSFINHLNHIETLGVNVEQLENTSDEKFNSKTPNQIVTEIIRKKNLTPKEISINTGLDEATIYRHVQNTLSVNRQAAIKYANYFGMDPSEILFNDIKIPLQGKVDFTFKGKAFDVDYLSDLFLKEYKQQDTSSAMKIYEKIEMMKKIQLAEEEYFPGKVQEQYYSKEKLTDPSKSLDYVSCPRDIYRPDINVIRVNSSESPFNEKDLFYYKEIREENLKRLQLCIFEIDIFELVRNIGGTKNFSEVQTQRILGKEIFKENAKSTFKEGFQKAVEQNKKILEQLTEFYSKAGSVGTVYLVGLYGNAQNGNSTIYTIENNLLKSISAATQSKNPLKIFIQMAQSSLLIQEIRPKKIYPVVAILDSYETRKDNELRSQLFKQGNLVSKIYTNKAIQRSDLKNLEMSVKEALLRREKSNNDFKFNELIKNIERKQLRTTEMLKKFRPDYTDSDGRIVELKNVRANDTKIEFDNLLHKFKQNQLELQRKLEKKSEAQKSIVIETAEANREYLKNLEEKIEFLTDKIKNLETKDGKNK